MKWYCHVFVRGHYSGCYEYDSEEAARSDMKERTEKLRPCGCSYLLSRNKEYPSPEMFGVYPMKTGV